MPYVAAEAIEAARQIDLLSYLRTREPGELVHISGNTYCTREHDSLKISNGKWHWFSRGIGGRNALDYLVKVKEMSFPDAVSLLTGTPLQAYTVPKEPVIPRERPAAAGCGRQLRCREAIPGRTRDPCDGH